MRVFYPLVMTILQDRFLEILFIHCLVKPHQERNLGRDRERVEGQNNKRTEDLNI